MAKRNSGEPLKEEEKRPLNSKNFKQLLGIFRFTLPYRGLFIIGFVALFYQVLRFWHFHIWRANF